ncbi:hypothetical protein CIB84_012449, partial [Bambusicola thoracicus]
MTHPGKREARPIAVELAKKLLPLFNHLQQDRQTVNEYLWQNLPYLENSQAPLRCEAVEFI